MPRPLVSLNLKSEPLIVANPPKSTMLKSTDHKVADEDRLAQLGYKQELQREFTSFSNFGLAFTVIGVMPGLSVAYGSIFWGWIVVSFFTMTVAASMAEICSTYPTSGGLYFWSSRLASPEWAPFMSWITGWFNLLGQFAVTAAIDFSLALMIIAAAIIGTDFAFTASAGAVVGVYIACVIIHAFINTFAIRYVAIMNKISVFWNIGGVIVIVIVCLALAPARKPASFVFGDFENNTGWQDSGLVFLLGLLQAQYTMTGYDGAAHISEETQRASVAAPAAIITGVSVAALVGVFFLGGTLAAIQSIDSIVNTETGIAIAQLFLDATGKNAALCLVTIVIVSQFLTGAASLTANSRMTYAFSRDGAIPGSRWWHRIYFPTTWKSPVAAVWLDAIVVMILGLPYLGSSIAFNAILSVSTIGLYISYALPILCRLIWSLHTMEKGPFDLGRWSIPLNIIAVLWVAFITVLFILPTILPVNALDMNYAIVAIGAVFFGAVGSWIFSARSWFKGPTRNAQEVDEGLQILGAVMDGKDVEKAFPQVRAGERELPVLNVENKTV
ncbi:amino acid permease-domain-containing protein [Endogone sp. FLAS-F59071]|nr:amino acid permease-domain-containing protein [Endogone sp. FLAS-F59071]|eukprot:RUS18509.1 amino acid permease-domain-containing protein [Endogone sp. FLAS-F59071]